MNSLLVVHGAEDRARTGHPDLGKVVLYQMSYFRRYFKNYPLFEDCKNKGYYLNSAKILFVFRIVLCVLRNIHIRVLITMRIKTITSSQYKNYYHKNLAEPEKTGRRYPAITKIFVLGFNNFRLHATKFSWQK